MNEELIERVNNTLIEVCTMYQEIISTNAVLSIVEETPGCTIETKNHIDSIRRFNISRVEKVAELLTTIKEINLSNFTFREEKH